LIGTSHTGTRSPNFRTNIDRQSSDGRGTRVAGEAKPPEQASTNSFSPVASLKNSLGDETDTKEKRSAPVTISNVVADGKPISADKSMKPLGEKTLTLADRSIRSASVKSRSQGKDKASARGYPKKHEVQRGDSYWALAEKYYKAGKYHALISKANSGKKLRPGMKVSIPAPPEPKKQKTSSPPSFVSSNPGIHVTTTTTVPSVGEQGRVESTRPPREELPESSDGRYVYYVVRKGDTLDGLARRFLKKGEAEKIRQANRSLIYTSLRAGQRIRIPKS
jgi:nucleoid-associated protein YgaU